MAIHTPNLTALRYSGQTPYKLRLARTQTELRSGDIVLLDSVTAVLFLRSKTTFKRVEGRWTFDETLTPEATANETPQPPKKKKGATAQGAEEKASDTLMPNEDAAQEAV
jgi:hypothetical protein